MAHNVRPRFRPYKPKSYPKLPDGVPKYTSDEFKSIEQTVAVMQSALDHAHVNPKTSSSALHVSDTGTLFTNEGAAGTVELTLPPAEAGHMFDFYVATAQTFKAIANAGDTIRIAGSVSAAAGNISNATVGGYVQLVAINATQWVARSFVGTWTVT